jgi:hypothetical protein
MDTLPHVSLEDRIAQLGGLPTAARILRLYEYAIEWCEQGRVGPVDAVFAEAMAAIDFGSGPVAEGFHRVYEYCLRKIRDGDLASVTWMLQDLRDACVAGHVGAAVGPWPPVPAGKPH